MSRSAPAFPFDYSQESVTLLVVGSAPCRMTDLNIAKALRPSHLIMAINDAAAWVPADFLFSFHAEKLPEFRAKARKQLTTHTANKKFARVDCADYAWNDVFIGASSAIGGAHVGLMMGFPEVILCGCPLDGGDGYFGPTHTSTHADPRFGLTEPHSMNVLGYHARLGDFAKLGAGLVFSLSGKTRQVLGAPPEVPAYGH